MVVKYPVGRADRFSHRVYLSQQRSQYGQLLQGSAYAYLGLSRFWYDGGGLFGRLEYYIVVSDQVEKQCKQKSTFLKQKHGKAFCIRYRRDRFEGRQGPDDVAGVRGGNPSHRYHCADYYRPGQLERRPDPHGRDPKD